MSLGDLIKQNMASVIPNAFTTKELEEIPDSEKTDEQKQFIREYWEKVNAPVIYQEYSAEELFSRMENDSLIVIDENNRRAIKILCLYFTNDKRFQEMGGSLQKGLMLRGGIGIGKTYLMELFMQNQKQCYSLKNCGEIASQFTIEGRGLLERFTDKLKTVATQKNFGQEFLGMCFDDLGCEKEGINYADRVEILAPILEMRYNRKLHALTHITTNLSPDELQQKYGDRLRSRMREMFNVIDFPLTATDRRK